MALDFTAGCLGGCAGVMVGHPLDTIKVHIQTQDFRNPKYTGTWHCFRTILARDSVSGLYRGMSSPMAGVAFVNAIVFGVYGITQRQLADPDALHSHFVAGATAGIAQSPVCSPMELAKTRLQLQSSSGPRFSGPVQCLKYIHRTEGFRGVFKGLGITFLREAPGYGIYFLTYETLTRSSSPSPISTFQMLMAGGLSGTASWIVTYPIDVIKSRFQAEVTGRYTSAMDCLRQSIKAEGYSCLFRGLNSTIIRAFPTNAATFAVVTWSFRLLGKAPEEQSQPAIVVKDPPRPLIPETAGILSQWQEAMIRILNGAHQSTSYSMLAAASFDGTLEGSSATSLTQDQVELPKSNDTEAEVGTVTNMPTVMHLVPSDNLTLEDEKHDVASKKRDESHVSAIVHGVPELVLVVDHLNTAFEEL